MRAVVQNGYGSQDVLSLKDIERPAVGERDVLVRVHATSVNAGDFFQMSGSPWLVRLMLGLRPRDHVLGWDVAGRVEAVGAGVTRFREGDEVYGACEHAFAEYARASEDVLAPRPTNLTLEQAAAIPTAGLTALQGLRDKRRVGPGHRVLVNGAAGGVGHFAVQVGRALGAEVTGVCSARNVDMVRSLGAVRVVDYAKEDFTRVGGPYDLILDNVANRRFRDLRRALGPEGIVVPNSGHGGMGYIINGALLSKVNRRQGSLLMTRVNHADLVVLKGMAESGDLRPVIDRTYPLERTPEAVAYVGTFHARGKVVITVG